MRLAAFAFLALLMGCGSSQPSQTPAAHTQRIAARSFSGVPTTDILFRNANGALVAWSVQGAHKTGDTNLGTADASWTVQAVADFDGDGRADVLWRNRDGALSMWIGDHRTAISNPGAAWSVADVGDYDGDGKADILWRNANGQLSIWTMNGATGVSNGIIGSVGPEWTIVPSCCGR